MLEGRINDELATAFDLGFSTGTGDLLKVNSLAIQESTKPKHSAEIKFKFRYSAT